MEHEETQWLEFAKTDIGVATHLNEQYYPKPIEIICYHCQQAAEKAIKAVIVAYNIQGGIPKKHNLSFLLEQLKDVLNIPEKYYDYADMLTPYGIAVRYPNEMVISEKNISDAILFAEEIIKWANDAIEKK